MQGCRVIGIAGSDEKCRYLIDELGFHGSINYKTDDVFKSLKDLCPNGIDVYFDNVGGDMLDIALLQLANKGRIVISEMISQNNTEVPTTGPKYYGMLLVRNARMEGFLAAQFMERYPEVRERIAGWIKEGSIKPRELIIEGVESFPETYPMLFDGRSFGKLLIKVRHE